jgi:guanine deaminase
MLRKMPEEKFMSGAIKEAYQGIKSGDGGPFGVVIVKGAELIAEAHNTVIRDNDPTHHAEINAISAASKVLGTYDLSGCTLYSTTEPCPMCFSAIHWARIDKVVYGTKIEDVKELGFNELSIPALKMKAEGASEVEIEEGVMLAECVELLRFWEALPDKLTY